MNLPNLDVVARIAALTPKQRRDGVDVVGPWGSAKALVAGQSAAALGRPLLYVTAGRIEAEAAYEDLMTFFGEEACAYLPAWEVLPTDAMAPADDIVAERMSALNRMGAARERGETIHVALSVRSLLQRVVTPKELLKDTVTLRVGEEYDLEDIIQRLVKLGYHRELMVEARGELSLRGGLFDVFPISSDLPYRIEFFGDEVESIRRFEPETQRSVGNVDDVRILPRSERALMAGVLQHHEQLTLVTEFLPKDTLVAWDEPAALRQAAEKFSEQFADTPFIATWDEVSKAFEKQERISLAQVAHAAEPGATRLLAPMSSMTAWSGKVDSFWEQLEAWGIAGYTVQLLCTNSGERRRLVELLDERGYTPGGQSDFDLRVDIGALREGFSSEKDKFALLSEREMFGRKYVRRTRRRFQAGTAITQFSDVKPGDYIVHIEHGIGRYLGLRRFQGRPADFMAIQYTGGDIVYIPVTHVDQVQKYIGSGGAVPKMDRIGGAAYKKAKSKVKKAVREMAEELLKLYAARESQPGHPFGADTHWQREFEDAFPYDETPDQQRAIEEIKRDMESPKPMERLLCGDVGFGKTEVAMRAAFKATMDHKQVAMLAPTTVLVEQHYKTFCERFADFPTKIEMLSRFRSPAEQRDIVRLLREGEIDIVIGTHRLTSGDIQFKDLGLVILDEEQRFGVKHKERLKKLKTNVDALTMSATPIPRTLHLSMSGVRDMSIINTAPNDRLPIHTAIEVYEDQLVAEAISREIGREGQVFYLHNRVQTIDSVASMVKKLVPGARVAVAHGQMNEHELEEHMTAFIRHETDVLVCTTIIGSGMDIPNANTIVVDRADMFGLSELYQLRGRVGRYKHRAFAYLLVPGDRALSEEAQQRLKALEEFSTLGSGFRIAMRDLEIRGAGDLLGGQQSGHIASVGFETYSQLIAEAVAELKGHPVQRRSVPSFDITADAFLPESYIELDSQKMTLYKRIAGLLSAEDVDEMYAELRDRFGDPPKPTRRLLEIMRARAMAGDAGAYKLFVSKGALTVQFEHPRSLGTDTQQVLRENYGKRVEFVMNERAAFRLTLKTDDPIQETQEALGVVADAN